jgi:hypothetical protein
MNSRVVFLLASLALLLPGNPATAKPAYEKGSGVPVGLLEIFTGTKTYNSGDILYFPHSSYAILRADGGFYRYVKNSTVPTDEVPFRILIPAGLYFIVAESEKEGRVKFPITIDSGQLSIIRLDNPNRNHHPPDSEAIRLENGSVAGWHWSRWAPRGCFERNPCFKFFGPKT